MDEKENLTKIESAAHLHYQMQKDERADKVLTLCKELSHALYYLEHGSNVDAIYYSQLTGALFPTTSKELHEAATDLQNAIIQFRQNFKSIRNNPSW